MPKPLVLLRWIAAVALMSWGFWHLSGLEEAGPVGLAGSLIGLGILGLGAALTAPEVLKVVCQPFFDFVDGLYGGGEKASRPPLDYHLADFYEKRRKFSALAINLEEIHSYYPKEKRPYFDLVEIYLTEELNDRRAKRLVRRARKFLEPEDADLLAAHWHSLLSMRAERMARFS